MNKPATDTFEGEYTSTTPTLSKEAERIQKVEIDISDWLDFDYHNNEMSEELLKISFSEYEEIAQLLAPRIAQIEQSAIQAERKAIYKMIMENGSANRASILHKLARIIQGEEKL